MKRMMLAAMALAVMAGAPGVCAAGQARAITARTEVTRFGQMPLAFEVRGQELPEGIGPEDFTITGEAAGWGTEATHPFACGVKEVKAAENGWDLVPEAFPEKYFFVRSMQVACEKQPGLSFSLAEIGTTVTPVADEFTDAEDADTRMKAHVFTPKVSEPCPVVIVFHGYGDTDNLLTYRTAVAWAEPEAQAKRPCYVIAPVIESMMYGSDMARARIFSGVMGLVDGLIKEGKADPDRIYVMGNSFGGMSSLEMAEQYPDRIAAVLALCPALNYSPQGMKRLKEITGIPVTIAQAEKDETIPSEVGRNAARILEEAGNDRVTLRIYTDEEMEACGAKLGQEQTYSFHHVELAVMEDESYAEWLFSQRKR